MHQKGSDGLKFPYSDGLNADLAQESLLLSGTYPKLPHVLIIYIGCGENGKSARNELRMSVLGPNNGAHVDASLLFKKEEFRISAGEHVDKMFWLIDETMSGEIDGSILKNLIGRSPILVRPPYGKRSEMISWDRCGFWFNVGVD